MLSEEDAFLDWTDALPTFLDVELESITIVRTTLQQIQTDFVFQREQKPRIRSDARKPEIAGLKNRVGSYWIENE